MAKELSLDQFYGYGISKALRSGNMDDNAAALTVGKWLTLVIFGDHFCLTFMSGMTTTYIWKLLELA